MLGGEITTDCKIHPSGRWITFAVMVGGAQTLWMVLDTGSPVSALSPRTGAILETRGLLNPRRDSNLYILRDLAISGQSIPDLELRILPRLDRLQVVGLLGLDFLRVFDDIHFNVPSLRLRLVPSPR